MEKVTDLPQSAPMTIRQGLNDPLAYLQLLNSLSKTWET